MSGLNFGRQSLDELSDPQTLRRRSRDVTASKNSTITQAEKLEKAEGALVDVDAFLF